MSDAVYSMSISAQQEVGWMVARHARKRKKSFFCIYGLAGRSSSCSFKYICMNSLGQVAKQQTSKKPAQVDKQQQRNLQELCSYLRVVCIRCDAEL